jgi:glycosyltransferase involved in cell wall biosynthesis
MNILILNWRDSKNPKSGGAEIVTMEHAKAWVKAGHQVTWFTSQFKNSKDEEEIGGVNVVRWGNSITVFLFAPFFYLFSGRKFDVVVDEIHGIPFFTPFYVRKPKIAFIHEVAGEIWDYMYSFPLNRIGKFIESFYFKFYKKMKFITVSESTKNDLMKVGINIKNINIILNGLSNRVLDTIPKKEKTPTFIFASRAVKMKGIEDVIGAFLYINKEMPYANFWIIGDGDKKYINKLKKQIEYYAACSRIKFFGRVSENEKLDLMKKAHLLLHASIKEGWGLVVTEAASQGTPSIVYNVSGLRDSVKNNKTGIVLGKNTPKEMAKEALKLLEDKERYKTCQVNGLAWSKSLTWEKAAKESLNLIKNTYENK